MLAASFHNAAFGAGAPNAKTIETSRRTGAKKYSALYFFPEVDGPGPSTTPRRRRRSEERPKGVVNEQVAREKLRYKSPTSQVGLEGIASPAGRSPVSLKPNLRRTFLATLCVGLKVDTELHGAEKAVVIERLFRLPQRK